MKKLLSYISTSIIVIMIFSCKKMLQIDPPKNQLVTSQVFSDTSNAKSAVNGIYTYMMSTTTAFGFANGGVTLLTGLSSDELSTTGINVSDLDFYNSTVSTENVKNQDILWRNAYKIIYQANACIEGLTASTTLANSTVSDSIKNQLLGECLVIRTFIYFNLVNLFGDVPLITTSDYNITRSQRRAAKDSLYSFMERELIKAKSLLSESYVGAGRIRPNKATASALLARVYLFSKKWPEAETMASGLISATVYVLEPDPNNVFMANSREAIWQLRPYVTGYETTEGQLFIPTTAATARPTYPISSELLNAFEPNDLRKTKWIASKTVSGQAYWYPYKYKLRMDNNTTPLENYMILRLGEQYLIRAEARAQQGRLSEAAADLNVIRVRAGLPATTATDQNQLLHAIYEERKIELFAEWGHRWYDLKRTSRADEILGVVKGTNWQSTDVLYPIPFSEIQLNANLTQNSGY